MSASLMDCEEVDDKCVFDFMQHQQNLQKHLTSFTVVDITCKIVYLCQCSEEAN